MEQALSDVKVLDLTHYVAGPYCTKLLADYGAEVIKIERPGQGDGARRMGPFYKDEPHPERSGLFLHLNTNKKGITLNLKSDTGKKIFKELIKKADILVENFSPRVMPDLGLDYDTLSAINPRLVMTSISNFGQTGPYRDFKASDLIFYGIGGGMYCSGKPDREPVKHAVNVVLYQAGAMTAPATLAAMYSTRHGNEGQHIDLSIMEAMARGHDMRSTNLVAYAYCGEINPRIPESRATYPVGAWPCKDGFFRLMGGWQNWDTMVKMVGEPEFLKDPKWKSPQSQTDPAYRKEFEAFFVPWLMERTKKELWTLGQSVGLTCSPLYTTEDLLHDSHFKGRGAFAKINHPETGELEYPGRPFIMSETPWQVKNPAPLLGQHNVEIYESLGYSKQDLTRLRNLGVI